MMLNPGAYNSATPRSMLSWDFWLRADVFNPSRPKAVLQTSMAGVSHMTREPQRVGRAHPYSDRPAALSASTSPCSLKTRLLTLPFRSALRSLCWYEPDGKRPPIRRAKTQKPQTPHKLPTQSRQRSNNSANAETGLCFLLNKSAHTRVVDATFNGLCRIGETNCCSRTCAITANETCPDEIRLLVYWRNPLGMIFAAGG